MKKYIDIVETKIDLDEEMKELAEETRESFNARLEFPFGVRDKINLNKRTYPRLVWDSAVNEYSGVIEAGWKLGDLDHPDSGGTKLSTASHLISKIWLDKDGRGMAEAYILKTTKGTDLLRILKSNVKIGASLRGIGEVDSNGVVKKGLKILAIDLVENPSFGADAHITKANIIESYIPGLSDAISTDIGELSLNEKHMAGIFLNPPKGWDKGVTGRTETEKKHFLEAVVAGYQGTFEDWKKERDDNA